MFNLRPMIKRLTYSTIPFEYRYEKTFRQTFRSLNESRQRSSTYRQKNQFLELKKLLIHCQKNVPYYTNLFRECQFEPSVMQSPTEIEVLPFLTKEIIQANFIDLQAVNYRFHKKFDSTTSGSTGQKLKIIVTDDVFKKEAAFVLRAYRDHGATLYDKPSVWLRRYVPKSDLEPLYKYDPELRRLYLSAYHLSDSNIEKYFELINQKKYNTLVGYPSSVYLLALLAEKHGLQLKNITAIHVASEMMLPMWRSKIISVFNLVPYAHYGQMEKVVFMHQSLDNEFYFNNLEYGYTEVIGTSESKEIIGTGFLNYAMPLVRYKTNDFASGVLFEKNILVGVESIIGRNGDFLTNYSGDRVPGVNFYSWINKNFPEITWFQIHQLRDKRIIFKYVTKLEKRSSLNDLIKNGLQARLGRIEFDIREVPSLERDETSNKFRVITSEV